MRGPSLVSWSPGVRYFLPSILTSVLTLLTSEHLISARSPTLNVLALAARVDGIAHVSPPTVNRISLRLLVSHH